MCDEYPVRVRKGDWAWCRVCSDSTPVFRFCRLHTKSRVHVCWRCVASINKPIPIAYLERPRDKPSAVLCGERRER